MKKIIIKFAVICALIANFSCEQVIDVDLDTASPKLVVEANINWQKGTLGNIQNIKLSTTTSYFSNTFPVVNNAIVTVKNSANTSFLFTELNNSGTYQCTTFVPQINEKYTLTIVSNGQTYSGFETLKPIVPITNITQKNDGGFLGNAKEIKTFYVDPALENNFYLYKYQYSGVTKPDFYVDEDEFFQGNPFFSISQNNDLKTGDSVTVTHFGISQQYYNYLSILLSQSGNTGGGPFQSPPATIRGNVINQTNFENFPLGYFSLSETDSRVYVMQ